MHLPVEMQRASSDPCRDSVCLPSASLKNAPVSRAVLSSCHHLPLNYLAPLQELLLKKKCMSVWLYKKFAPNNHKIKPVTVNRRAQQEFSETWFHGRWSWIAEGNRGKNANSKHSGGASFLVRWVDILPFFLTVN